MNTYREFQFSRPLLVIVVLLQILNTVMYVGRIGTRVEETSQFIIPTVILFLIFLLFYGMATKIEGRKIVVSFGIGLIRANIDIDEIQRIVSVKNPWYYGWGIRLIPNGELYNIDGSAGIEIKFTNKKRVIRIGTKNPTQLIDEINKRKSRPPGNLE